MSDYEKVWQSLTKMPKWKKELINEYLLISKHSPKL